MRVLILGSGLLGTTSAWYLSARGHEVTVVDRQPGAGLETSFANGGQISVSHAEPWANPHAPAQVLRWLGREDAPLLFRFRADPALWAWGLRFLFECLPSRTRYNIAQLVNLGIYSRASLQALRRETGITYDHLERGILHFYTTQESLDAGIDAARTMRDYGCDSEPVTREECLRLEPALAESTVPIVGGTFTPTDESGNAHVFTRKLAALCAQRGVHYEYDTQVLALRQEGGRIAGVTVRTGTGPQRELKADVYVVALGSYSPQMLRPVGISIPVYPAKGYSVTMPVRSGDCAPVVSLTDDEHKLVFSRLGDQLRIAGTAELNGYNTEINEVRCEAIVRRVKALFPQAGDFSQARYWTGLRPATPGNVPCIGRSRIPNLYLNTGHGTLGWTHSCGSGKALAELIDGRTPEVDFAFLGGPGRASHPVPAPRARDAH